MMTQPAAPWHGWPNEPASIERLPPELLLPIVSSLPGLDTLWNLLRASPNTLRLFNCNANTITEGILSGPNSILPSNVQELVRGVILARSKSLPFKNLNDFQVRHMFGLFDPSMAKETELITLGPGTLSVSNPPVAVLRSVVATAYQISALSQACLASCLERTRALRVMHPIDPKICYTDDNDHPNKIVPAFDRKYPGTPAKMVGAGQPTWVEEMRAVRAIWVIQMVGEMRRLSSNKADMIDWPDKDIDRLNKLDLAKFFRIYRADYDGQEIASAEEYLKTLGEVTHDVYHCLPRPPPASPVTRWTTALPIPEETTWVVRGYVLNGEFHRLHPGSSLPAGAKRWKTPKYSKDHSWGRTDTALNKKSYGVKFFKDLATTEAGPGESPICGVEFDSFRPLGFAFWDRWRMHLLGLAPDILHSQLDFYYYAWESILPPEEVASVKNALREDWWRSSYKYNATLAAGRAQQSLGNVLGTSCTTTVEPSKTSDETSYPTHTTFTGDGYCYSGKSGFLKFTQSRAQQVIKSFCSSSSVLEPGNAIGQADALEEDGYNVVVSAKWATDQTGCGTKEAFHFADDQSNFESCLRAWNIPFSCTDPDASSSFGSAYVFDPPTTGGCLLLRLYAYSTSSLKVGVGLEGALAPAVMNITHMGDVKHRVNKPNAPLVWPTSKSEDGTSLFSAEEVKKLVKDTTKES